MAGAVGQILMIMAGVTDRTKTVVHKSGVPRMAMVVVDQKPRMYPAVVVGDVEVVVVVMLVAVGLC